VNADLEYLESRVLTARPEHLHLMVIDGALRHCRLAEQALREQCREQAFEQLSFARDYMSELIGGLNAESNKELVGSVAQLFVFVYRRLVEADIDHSGEKIRDAIHILEHHRETWLQLIDAIRGTEKTLPAAAVNNPHEAATFNTAINGSTTSAPMQSFSAAADDETYQPRSWST